MNRVIPIERYVGELLVILQNSATDWISACGYRLSVMKREFTSEVQTMGVDGVTFYVNPDWPLSRLPEATHQQRKLANLFTLIHEALHVFFRHPERLRDFMNAYPEIADVFHQAADYAINLHAVQKGCPYPMPEDGLYSADYVDSSGNALNLERIAKLLMQDIQQQQPEAGDSDDSAGDDSAEAGDSDSGSSDSDSADSGSEAGDSQPGQSPQQGNDTAEAEAGNAGGDSGSDSGADSGDSADNGATPESCGELLPAPDDIDPHQVAQEHIAAAKLARAAGHGTLPDWLQDEIDGAACNAKKDWLTELHDKFADVVVNNDYSFEQFDQAYACIGMIEPTLYSEGIGKVAIVGDESSSMSDDELQIITAQTKSIIDEWSPQETLIIRHTSEIVYTESLQEGQEPTLRKKRSHGGTDFMPVIEMVEAEQCDVVIWITDCAPCDNPRNADVPVIWLGTDSNARFWFERELNYGDFIEVNGS